MLFRLFFILCAIAGTIVSCQSNSRPLSVLAQADSIRKADSLKRLEARALVRARLDSIRVADSIAAIKTDIKTILEHYGEATYLINQVITDDKDPSEGGFGTVDGMCSVTLKKDGVATLVMRLKNQLSINGKWSWDGSTISIRIGSAVTKGYFNSNFTILTLDNTVVGAYGWNGSTILQMGPSQVPMDLDNI